MVALLPDPAQRYTGVCHVWEHAPVMSQQNRLEVGFRERSAAGRSCVLPYITAGYPDLDCTLALLDRLRDGRIGAIELGIPYSDPIADGPVIQTSFYRALAAGFRLDDLFGSLKGAQQHRAHPLIAMVSYSIVFRRGIASFVESAAAAGIAGLIVPDIAWEEAGSLSDIAARNHVSLIMIVAPTTSSDRAAEIARLSTPFTYYQASLGVTGERGSLASGLSSGVAQVRRASGKPVCAGFGISTPDQVREVCAAADGAIVGSAIVRRMNDAVDRNESRSRLVQSIGSFVDQLAAAVPG